MRILAIAPVFALALAPIFAQSTTTPPLPRKAPEIAIVEPGPDGNPAKTTQLSSYRGKVIVLALVSTECPHCQAECRELTKIYTDMKSKGVQMVAIAFNDNAKMLVTKFVREQGVLFPVGSTSFETMAAFMGFSVMDRPVVPQLAVIDRKGMIRAQTPPAGDPNLQDEGNMRSLLAKLVAEPAAPTTTTKATPRATPKSGSN